MALKLYTLLNDELIPFEELDAPDMFYQYYPNLYPGSPKGVYSNIANYSQIFISAIFRDDGM